MKQHAVPIPQQEGTLWNG